MIRLSVIAFMAVFILGCAGHKNNAPGPENPDPHTGGGVPPVQMSAPRDKFIPGEIFSDDMLKMINSIDRSTSLGWQYAELQEEALNIMLAGGSDPNYRDPASGYTPLLLALAKNLPDIAGLLIEYGAEPVMAQARNIVNFTMRRLPAWKTPAWISDYMLLMYYGLDDPVLSGIQGGSIDIRSQDPEGHTFLDYAAWCGSAQVMEALIPFIENPDLIFGQNPPQGLFFEALEANNSGAARVLAEYIEPYIETDRRGHTYPVQYLCYDFDEIQKTAETIKPRTVVLQYRDGGTELFSPDGNEIHYMPNRYFTLQGREGLALYTRGGGVKNLDAVINEARASLSGWENPPKGPSWHIAVLYDRELAAYTRSYYGDRESEICFINIDDEGQSLYMLDRESLKINTMNALYEPYTWIDLFEDIMELKISDARTCVIKRTGEVYIFNHRDHSAVFEKAAAYRECVLPEWDGAERAFVKDGMVTAYNFRTGAERALGRQIEIPYYAEKYRNYLFETENGERYIVEAGSLTICPEPEGEYHNFAFFENGYIYTDNEEQFFYVCLLDEDQRITQKLILTGSAITRGGAFSVYGNKIYRGSHGLGFTIDMSTTKVIKSYASEAGGNTDTYVYLFPFGENDIVYTYVIDYGK
jgi:hypothetical protein